MECQFDKSIYNELNDEQKSDAIKCLEKYLQSNAFSAADAMFNDPNYFDSLWEKKPQASVATKHTFEASILKTPKLFHNDALMTIDTRKKSYGTAPNNLAANSLFLNIEEKEREPYNVLFECKGTNGLGVTPDEYLKLQEMFIRKRMDAINKCLNVIRKLIDFKKEKNYNNADTLSILDREVKTLEDAYNIQLELRKKTIQEFEQMCLQYEMLFLQKTKNDEEITKLTTEIEDMRKTMQKESPPAMKPKFDHEHWIQDSDIEAYWKQKSMEDPSLVKYVLGKIPFVRRFAKPTHTYFNRCIILMKELRRYEEYQRNNKINSGYYELTIVETSKRLPLDYKPIEKYNELYKQAALSLNIAKEKIKNLGEVPPVEGEQAPPPVGEGQQGDAPAPVDEGQQAAPPVGEGQQGNAPAPVGEGQQGDAPAPVGEGQQGEAPAPIGEGQQAPPPGEQSKRVKQLSELATMRTALIDKCKEVETAYLNNEKNGIGNVDRVMNGLQARMNYATVVKTQYDPMFEHIYNSLIGFPKHYGNHLTVGECSNSTYDLNVEFPVKTQNQETRIVVPSFEMFLHLVKHNFAKDTIKINLNDGIV